MNTESVKQLFSKYSVGEIRELEKKTRNEIETKKEDLRQMVGERYRDLIEAADTIAEMKKCASDVKDSVQRLQKYTSTELRSGKFAYTKSKSKANSIDRYMQLSAQVKLLMEMSETIWSRVEGGNMIEATHLYMQSRQVLKNLHLDGSTTYCPILQWFPVLGQQAQALDNLRSTILTECRRQLQDNNLNSKPLSEALCSIILLEESDITKAFPEFMDARFAAIASKFEELFGDSVEETGSTKLCKVVILLAATLKQAYQLFVAPVKGSEVDDKTNPGRRRSTLSQGKDSSVDLGLVSHVLKESYRSFAEKCTDYEKSGSIHEERIWCKHLPESVSKLTSLQHGNMNASLPATAVQSTCQEWLNKCKSSIQNGTLKLLSYVATFRGLATLRQSLWDTLNEMSDMSSVNGPSEESWKVESGDAVTSEWEEACLATLGRRLLLWDEILKDLFLDKVKSLSKNLLVNLLTNGKEKLNSVLENLQRTDQTNDSTSQFIWHELASDILPNTAWKQVSIRKVQEVKGGLGLKALTVTPTLHGTCVQLNTSMKDVLTDLFNYIPDTRKEDTKSHNFTNNKTTKNNRITPTVEKGEKLTICADFQKSCVECLKDFLKVLASYESSLAERLTTERSSIDEILFLAMFCRNFCQLCGEFQVGCTISDEASVTGVRKQSSSSSGSMSSSLMSQSLYQQPIVSPIWEEINVEMSGQSRRFLKLWSDATITKAISNFKTETLNLKLAVHLFDTMPTWDTIQILEESEAGSKVESQIRLPMAVSWPVLELLHDICESISRVGGHSMSRSTLQDITLSCLNGVLHTYIELKNSVAKLQDPSNIDNNTSESLFSPTQSWALQKLFDLRSLHGSLHSSIKSTENEKPLFDAKEDSFSDLVDWLESYIDPFDLDVFASHLTKNIQRSIHCSAVMLGFITPSDKSESLHSTHSISKSAGNSHNILPLTTDCGRFSYLPISNRMSKSDAISLPASIKNHLPLSTALKQITDADKRKVAEGGRKQSLYSKLGALSSSWLSSMATSDN